MIDAWNSMTGTPVERNAVPVSPPAAKVGGQALAGITESPRYTMRDTPAPRAARAHDVSGCAHVPLLERPPRAQRVHQVVRGV